MVRATAPPVTASSGTSSVRAILAVWPNRVKPSLHEKLRPDRSRLTERIGARDLISDFRCLVEDAKCSNGASGGNGG